jgi:adhesin HecA-like repeat protein
MGNRRSFFRNASSAGALALAGFIVAATGQSALASSQDRMSFREFRQQNEGLAKNAARQLFREQFGRNNSAFNGALPGLTYQPNSQPVRFGAGAEPIFSSNKIAGLRHTRETRVRNQSMQELSGGNITRVNRGVELDLSSTSRNIVLGRSLFDAHESVEISVNGKIETFSAGSEVTAAEYVAVKQVLSGGTQQIEVDRSGRASGGSVDLGALTADNDVMRASSLVIPKDVTTSGDFGRQSDFRLTGDLLNFGTVQTLSTDSNIRGGAIKADNVVNHSGALIAARGDLALDAEKNLTNYGIIAASGNLSLSAGDNLTNRGTVAAGENLRISSGNVVNRGSLNANAGDLSFATTGGELLVDNRDGKISALNGAINVRDSFYAGAADSLIVGGDLLSRELNLNAGLGTASVNVMDLTGVINETGSAAHVAASTEALNIGNVCLTGDPTFFNRISFVNIIGDITVAEDLTIVAASDIFASDDVNITAGDSSQGYNVTLIAGAAFFSTSGSDQFAIGPISGPPYTCAGAVTVVGGSKNGGGIYFGDNVKISTRSTDLVSAGDRAGGNVEIFAFGKNQGQIFMPGTTIETGGVNLGDNGNVLVVGEHTFKNYEFPTILIDAIDTTNQTGGAQGAGGNLSISTAKPIIVGDTTVVYDANGSRSGPGRLVAGDTVTPFSWVILGSNTNPTAVAGDLVINSDYTIVSSDVTAKTITSNTEIGLRVDTGSLTGTDSVTLNTAKKGTIGYSSPVAVATPQLTVNAPGGSLGVQIISPGVTEVSITGKAGAVFAPSSLLTGSLNFDDDLVLIAGDLDLAPIAVKNNLTVGTTVVPLVDDGTRYSAKNLFLNGSQIGVNPADPFVVNSSVKKLAIAAGDAFVATSGSKKPPELIGADVDNLVYTSTVGMTITGSINATETLSLQTTGKTIAIDDLVLIQAADSISIINSGTTKKDKITLAKSSALETSSTNAGQGNILVQLGAAGGAAVPAPPNVSVNGNVQILGLGLSAKSPVNTLTGTNAGVTISNSVAPKNISLGGNVQISASGP